MFTLSIRPSASTKPTNLCMNFEQESSAWKPSTFSNDPTPGDAFGLCFYSPLENVEITTAQLGAMIAGLEGAYDTLASNIFEQADSILSKTPFGTKDMFMQCIPRGIFETQPDVSDMSEVSGAKAAMPVLLVSKDMGKSIVYDGQHWVVDTIPVDIDTYSSAGMCFGWGVRYTGDGEEKVALSSDDLVEMLDGLLYHLTYLNTDAKLFVKNLESAQ